MPPVAKNWTIIRHLLYCYHFCCFVFVCVRLVCVLVLRLLRGRVAFSLFNYFLLTTSINFRQDIFIKNKFTKQQVYNATKPQDTNHDTNNSQFTVLIFIIGRWGLFLYLVLVALGGPFGCAGIVAAIKLNNFVLPSTAWTLTSLLVVQSPATRLSARTL